MPGIVKIKDLEERKRALIRESDLYRETLIIEIHNLHLYALRTRDRFAPVKRWSPLFALLGPLALNFFRRRSAPKVRWLTRILLVWRVFKRLRFLLPRPFGRRRQPRKTVPQERAGERA
jgi:hypothetical protein